MLLESMRDAVAPDQGKDRTLGVAKSLYFLTIGGEAMASIAAGNNVSVSLAVAALGAGIGFLAMKIVGNAEEPISSLDDPR